MPSDVCSACGHVFAVGDFPFCPHQRGSQAVIGDDRFIGGMTLENLDHDPVTVYSRSELKREMDARGLQSFVRHMPLKGTDKSPHTTDWSKGSIDPQTLANAKALVSRQPTVKATPTDVPLKTLKMTIREITP